MKKVLLLAALLSFSGHTIANTCTSRQAGATDQTVYVEFIDATTGVPNAAQAFNSSGIDIEYVRVGAAATDITEVTQTAGGAHTDGGFVSVGHGRYRLDLPDAAVAAGVPEVVVQGVITGYIMLPCVVALSPAVNAVAVGGTAQTGRDLGASVLLSSGTGTGQLSISSGLLAWNPAWDAEVQSEVQDAVEVNHLDHLLAVDYDPASKPGVATALLNELVESDGGVSRFTSNALEQAPTAGGGNITQIEGVDATDVIDARIAAANILRPTTAGRTLDVTATGEAGIDWSNIGAPTTTVALTGTTISTTQSVNVTQISGDSGAADALEVAFDGTAGPVPAFGIARQFTAASATGTTLVMDGPAAFADGTAVGMTAVACGSTQGYCQSRAVTGSTGDTLTVDTWTVTPSGTITGYLFSTAPSSGGGGLDAAGIRGAVGLASANLDTQLSGLQSDTDNLQTRVPTSLVSGRIDASVGAMATGVVTATAVAADAIGASELAADAATEIGTATWATTTRLLTAGTNIVLAKGTGVTGFNDVSTAQVNTEVDTALADIHLDHLLAADYDPASKPGVATALMNELVENDGGVSRFTANALEQGPAGGGGSTNVTQIEGVDATDVIDARIAAAGLASQASVDDVPTNAELATALGTADDAVLAAVADLPTNAELATALGTADDAVLAAVADVPTNAELATALGTADDAVLAAVADVPTNAELTAALAAQLASQRILTGTCDSGSTTTCVDDALTQAAASQLEDRLICFDDSWCAMLTTFSPGSDTATTTKVAPSTRASKAYTIFPSTTE